jgi:L-fuculose-phosphate aldolase
MMRAGRSARLELVAAARALHERGWVANHDGNLTLRLGPGRFLATPTATSKGRVEDGNLLEVDASGTRTAGSARPFGEIGLHLLVFERRPDVGAVVHAHPPHATAIACAPENPIERPFIAEAVVSLGAWIPRVPFAAPGAAAREALAPYVEQVDAALLGNHGVIAWGADLEQAMLRLELVEHLARIALLARAAGGVQALPEAAIGPLLAARAKAGLGLAADRAATPPLAATPPARQPLPAPPVRSSDSRPPVVACAPAPHASDVDPEELARIVREELLRATDGG